MEYPPFANEPLSDFSDPARRATFAHTLARVDAELGPTWSRSMLIGGEKVETGAWLESHDPTTPGGCGGGEGVHDVVASAGGRPCGAGGQGFGDHPRPAR